jgi:hypothetical protein
LGWVWDNGPNMHSQADDFVLVRRVGTEWTFSTESAPAVLQDGVPQLSITPTLYPTLEEVETQLENEATEFGAYLEEDLDLLQADYDLVHSGAISRTDPRPLSIRLWEYFQEQISSQKPGPKTI